MTVLLGVGLQRRMDLVVMLRVETTVLLGVGLQRRMDLVMMVAQWDRLQRDHTGHTPHPHYLGCPRQRHLEESL